MIIASIDIVPVGTGTSGVSEYVAAAEKVLKKHSNIKHLLTPMSTVVEAESPDELFALIKEMNESVFSKGVKRVLTNIRIDDRRDKQASMDAKIQSVKTKL